MILREYQSNLIQWGEYLNHTFSTGKKTFAKISPLKIFQFEYRDGCDRMAY